MGTNYYAIAPECPNPCAHCEQQTEWHLCKSLVMFEQHTTSPWGPISEWEDWKRVLTTGNVVIRDEYGREHAAAGFIADVEATELDRRGRQYRWLLDHGYLMDDDYLDSDGFSWHRGEFS